MNLNIDIYYLILGYLTLPNLIKIRQVCKTFNKLSHKLINKPLIKSELLIRMSILSHERGIHWSQQYSIKSDGVLMLHEYLSVQNTLHQKQLKRSLCKFLLMMFYLNEFKNTLQIKSKQ